jgi:hypothetical protein
VRERPARTKSAAHRSYVWVTCGFALEHRGPEMAGVRGPTPRQRTYNTARS